MTRRSLLFLSALILSRILTGFMGCGSDSEPTTPGPDPENFYALLLSDEDQATVAALDDRYHELRTALSPPAARIALVDEINAGWENTTSALLASDGVSVQVAMSGGETVVMIMDEASSYRPEPPADKTASEETQRPFAFKGPDETRRQSATKEDPSCDEITVPSSQKIHIVNLVGAIFDYTVDQAEEMRQHIIELGWDPDDVVLTQVTSTDDYNLTLQEILDQTGYGAVLLITPGGTREYDGREHTIHGIWNGGEYRNYQDRLTPTEWEQIQNWKDADKLVPVNVTRTDGEGSAPIWAIRDDLLIEQLAVDPGTLVSIAGAFGSGLRDGLLDGDAGMVTSWTGACPMQMGLQSFEVMIEHMAEGDDGLHALSAARNSDWGYYDGTLGTGMIGTDSNTATRYHFPAQLDFEAPDECAEPGTTYYEVDVTYADCPEHNQSFQFFRGGEFSLKGLPPYGAELTIKAKNADGEAIGAAPPQALDLTSGPNDVDLCPCEGTFTADLGELPPGTEGLAVFAYYDDPDAGYDFTYHGGNISMTFEDLLPLESTLEFYARDGEGNDLGLFEIEDMQIGCDGTAVSGCFGWLEFSSSNYPAETATIEIGQSGESAFPNPMIFAPGGTGNVYGFQVGEEVDFWAIARDSEGETLATTYDTQEVGCGPNDVVLDFANFGVVLSANPESVPANGVDLITLTATVRMWRDFDLDEPTGDPVAFINVVFETDLGEFWGDSMGYTDTNGEVSVSINSEEAGDATIQAHTSTVVVQAEPIVVQFAGLMTLVLDGDPDDWDGAIGTRTEYYCMHLDGTLDGSMFALDHFETHHWHYQVSEEVGSPGDLLHLTWTPQGGCADGDPYDYPMMGPVYLHYFYGTDYDHQITVLLSEGHVPLEDVVEAQITLQDPAEESGRSGVGAGQRTR